MGMGLLGAVQGLGQGLQQTGTTLFNDEISNRREQRLQAIRDKEYARNRSDQLADQQTSMQFQRDERIAGQDYQNTAREDSQDFTSGQNEQDRTLREKLADKNLDAFTSFETDDKGVVYGINAKGGSTPISGFKTELISFGDLTDLKGDAQRELQLLPSKERAAEIQQFIQTLDSALTEKMRVGGYGIRPASRIALDRLAANPDEIESFVEEYGYRPPGY